MSIISDRTILGVADRGVNLVGAIALDHHGRIGLITGRGRTCTGDLMWKGVAIELAGKHWRWTSTRPIVVAANLKEYAEATDDLLGLDALRGNDHE